MHLIFLFIFLIFLNACEALSTGSNPNDSNNNSNTSGWGVVVSSGSTVVANPQYSGGGVTDGKVAGSFDLFVLPSDTTKGWAVGNLGEVLATTDSGDSATSIATFPSSGILRSVKALSANKIFVAGQDTQMYGASIFLSTDGGTIWNVVFNTYMQFPDRSITSTDRINALFFVNTTTGYAVGGLGDNTNLILKTTDGGQNWSNIYRVATTGLDDELHTVFFLDENTGYVGGNTGLILRTKNGGTTWTQGTVGVTPAFYEIRCADASRCYAAADNGTVYKMDNISDSVFSWLAQITGITDSLYALDIIDREIWAGGENGTLIYSADDGLSWTKQTTNSTYPIQAIFMITNTDGFAAAAYSTSNTGAILKTTTGGN